MKKVLLSTVALVGLTAGAMAADLPMRAAPPPPVVAAVPVFTWTGFYIGVNGGVAFHEEQNDRTGNAHHHHHRLVRGDGIRDTVRNNGRNNGNNSSNDDVGPLGGGQIGYNMQFGMFVLGVEADIQAIDFGDLNNSRHRHHTANFPNGRPNNGMGGNNGGNGGNGGNRMNGGNNDDDGVDAFGTVRGRLGLAAFDRGLLYITGGLAYKSDENNNGNNNGGGNNGGMRSGGNGGSGNDDNNIGYTIGGGVEYAFTNSVSLKIEGLYVDFSEGDNNGRNRNNNGGNNGGMARFNGNDNGSNGREFGLVRAGINYRFNTF